jgi:hypothetical protein
MRNDAMTSGMEVQRRFLIIRYLVSIFCYKRVFFFSINEAVIRADLAIIQRNPPRVRMLYVPSCQNTTIY